MESEHLEIGSDPPIGSDRKGVLHRCPPGVVLDEATTIDVHSGEEMIAPEREVPATVLEMDIRGGRASLCRRGWAG